MNEVNSLSKEHPGLLKMNTIFGYTKKKTTLGLPVFKSKSINTLDLIFYRNGAL